MRAFWLAFVVGGAALAAPLSLVWEVPAATLTWKSDLALKGEVALLVC